MPQSEEVAMIVVNGQRYRDWETVWVHVEFPGIFRTFRFSVSEGSPMSKNVLGLQLKPGDFAEVYLAGELAISGYIYERQAYADAARHGVRLTGQSKPGDTTRTSIMEKGGEFRDYNLIQIARKLYDRYGISVVTKGDTSRMERKFEQVQVMPGEPPFHLIDRLARMRGTWVGDNEKGELVLHGDLQQGGSAALVEGQNIQYIRGTITDLALMSTYMAYGASTANDKQWGKTNTQPTYTAENQAIKRYKPYKFEAERVLTPGQEKEDLKIRVGYEMAWRASEAIEIEVGVYGWTKGSGGLWTTPDSVEVVSPMMPLNQSLMVRAVTFTQDNAQGTMTALSLANPLAMTNGEVQLGPGNGFGGS